MFRSNQSFLWFFTCYHGSFPNILFLQGHQMFLLVVYPENPLDILAPMSLVTQKPLPKLGCLETVLASSWLVPQPAVSSVSVASCWEWAVSPATFNVILSVFRGGVPLTASEPWSKPELFSVSIQNLNDNKWLLLRYHRLQPKRIANFTLLAGGHWQTYSESIACQLTLCISNHAITVFNGLVFDSNEATWMSREICDDMWVGKNVNVLAEICEWRFLPIRWLQLEVYVMQNYVKISENSLKTLEILLYISRLFRKLAHLGSLMSIISYSWQSQWALKVNYSTLTISLHFNLSLG